jgi:site-specific DNA recombinase
MSVRSFRCAVYTRKSTEDGLEQDFNSLHAQREACEAYIRSQASEGWQLIKEHYDDGGISGATMQRPALKHLLADIAEGKVDIVVVYKIDRLTRSLMDFARMVELFDKNQVSFVSVTQQFNTTTSMGRLTLNVLLSFAQFEREVTAERIRDKIAASKKKGMWMGGPPPLGYDVENRQLVINETEANTVRTIYRLYLNCDGVSDLKDDLDRQGIRSKLRTYANGKLPSAASPSPAACSTGFSPTRSTSAASPTRKMHLRRAARRYHPAGPLGRRAAQAGRQPCQPHIAHQCLASQLAGRPSL